MILVFIIYTFVMRSEAKIGEIVQYVKGVVGLSQRETEIIVEGLSPIPSKQIRENEN